MSNWEDGLYHAQRIADEELLKRQKEVFDKIAKKNEAKIKEKMDIDKNLIKIREIKKRVDFETSEFSKDSSEVIWFNFKNLSNVDFIEMILGLYDLVEYYQSINSDLNDFVHKLCVKRDEFNSVEKCLQNNCESILRLKDSKKDKWFK